MNIAAKKQYKVLCWGDCKKFPEIKKCSLDWMDRMGNPQHANEGEVRDDLLIQDIGWLLRDHFIEEVKGGDSSG